MELYGSKPVTVGHALPIPFGIAWNPKAEKNDENNTCIQKT